MTNKGKDANKEKDDGGEKYYDEAETVKLPVLQRLGKMKGAMRPDIGEWALERLCIC